MKSRRIKVLYISPVGERGGAEMVLFNILRQQNRGVFEPIVCFLKEGSFVEEVRRLGVRTFLFPMTRVRHLKATLNVVRCIRSPLRLLVLEGARQILANALE